jgi:TolB protein
MRPKQIAWLSVVIALVFLFASEANHSWAKPPASPVGIFEDHADVGTVLHPGSVEYDASKQTYNLTGSGENVWFAADAFQFVWKKLSGDVTLTADISFPTTTGIRIRKPC